MPQPGLQPRPALHPEQSQVSRGCSGAWLWGSRAVWSPGPSWAWTGGAHLARAFSSIAADFLPTFMYCLGSRDFEVVQTALRNLPEYTLLCQGEAAGPSLPRRGASGALSPGAQLRRVSPQSTRLCCYTGPS